MDDEYRNLISSPRKELQERYGQVWTHEQLEADFDVIFYAGPYVIARRKSDRVKGSLMFQHEPRLYFKFIAGA